jgi:hypothetical protein
VEHTIESISSFRLMTYNCCPGSTSTIVPNISASKPIIVAFKSMDTFSVDTSIVVTFMTYFGFAQHCCEN